ncbi:hypothetical protein EUGRSUZ_D02501 [Eucalyptus grandis]|uniref:Uncharacterized protein n=2 Tax=Eucalyptus grandis TaxID=71139 RepID=A0ACC3L7T4_EUCGR|nr:hypothetical protein EUGRSUZ_D02501 [Eucalyptus grandis]
MATVAESSDPNPNPNPNTNTSSEHAARPKSIGDATPWVDYAVDQARLLRKGVEDDVGSFAEASRSRLAQIRSTAAAHTMMTVAMIQDTFQEVKSKYDAYEDIFFGKVKGGIEIAASNPMLTAGVVTGSGFIVLKRPRRFLYYNTLRLLMSEESMLSRADAKVKELRKSIDLLKAESEKLERRAQLAEEEMLRGRTKLRQAGKQIQSVSHSAYKIERQAAGLKDVIRELPRREASRFRSQVSFLHSREKGIWYFVDAILSSTFWKSTCWYS